ncbi:MAG TPA: hypothetical protein VFE62_24205, partial [Gemmataceae bacterium]|nr:hypothetical protein [Gemmataceae bacterium]
RKDVDLAIEPEYISLLSIGTGKAAYFASPPAEGAGALWWAPNLYNVSSVSQAQGINFQAQYFLGDRLTRIDYDLPDGQWSLDSVGMLSEMINIGHERCKERLVEVRDKFFAVKAQHPFVPFEPVQAAG